MPDEHTPVTGIWEVLRGQLATHHERLNEMRSIQIETVGRDGRNGKLQQVRRDMGKLTEAVEANQKTIQSINRRIEGMGVRLGLLVGGASFVAAAVGAVVVKLAFGGS